MAFFIDNTRISLNKYNHPNVKELIDALCADTHTKKQRARMCDNFYDTHVDSWEDFVNKASKLISFFMFFPSLYGGFGLFDTSLRRLEPSLPLLLKPHVSRWDHEQRNHGRRGQPEDYHDGQRPLDLRPCSRGDDQWQQPQGRCDGCHEHGAELRQAPRDHGVLKFSALLAELLKPRDQYDPVGQCDPKQCDESDG